MGKRATTIDEQISLLEKRGLIIRDKLKAREILLDVGYYRLGFYLFPLEKSYPYLKNRTHQYIDHASFEDAVRLYYFDFDLRMLLIRYLNRIEIAFRTTLIYSLSTKYNENEIWFMSKDVMKKDYLSDFRKKVYTTEFMRHPIIRRHHLKYPNDRFAPAWKTLEFMTFGSIMKLYENLKDIEDQIEIANHFGIRQVETFKSYMHTIRQVRNVCAHSLLLYDLNLPLRIKRGPAKIDPQDSGNIIGALRVIKFIMEGISISRTKEMLASVKALYVQLCESSPILRDILPNLGSIPQKLLM